MLRIKDVTDWMEGLAPLRLSAEWDNTGLLLGDLQREVRRLMTCLTLTPESVAEAVSGKADLVISHHPLPFRPLKKIIASEPAGRMLWELARAGVSVYCPHTAWDSAAGGINAQLANRLQLRNIVPLVAEATRSLPEKGSDSLRRGPKTHENDSPPMGQTPFRTGSQFLTSQSKQADSVDQLGAGRVGDLVGRCNLRDITKLVCEAIPHCRPRVVDAGLSIGRVGVVCGSGGSLIEAAFCNECDLFLTGEATFHQCLEAKGAGLSMLMIGHFASEKFAMDSLAGLCRAEFAGLEVWGSVNETDPVSSI